MSEPLVRYEKLFENTRASKRDLPDAIARLEHMTAIAHKLSTIPEEKQTVSLADEYTLCCFLLSLAELMYERRDKEPLLIARAMQRYGKRGAPFDTNTHWQEVVERCCDAASRVRRKYAHVGTSIPVVPITSGGGGGGGVVNNTNVLASMSYDEIMTCHEEIRKAIGLLHHCAEIVMKKRCLYGPIEFFTYMNELIDEAYLRIRRLFIYLLGCVHALQRTARDQLTAAKMFYLASTLASALPARVGRDILSDTRVQDQTACVHSIGTYYVLAGQPDSAFVHAESAERLLRIPKFKGYSDLSMLRDRQLPGAIMEQAALFLCVESVDRSTGQLGDAPLNMRDLAVACVGSN